jgi:hypothetical protein
MEAAVQGSFPNTGPGRRSPARGQNEPVLGRSPRPADRDAIPRNQDDQQHDDGNQDVAAWMSVLIASNLTVEELVEDDSRDDNRKADPPVAA